jgi:SAM-dependent methyltransferase
MLKRSLDLRRCPCHDAVTVSRKGSTLEDEMTTEASPIGVANVDRHELRLRISEKYREVATTPETGFHFHTGRPLAAMLGYPLEVVDGLPAGTVDSFAGTGNPWLYGQARPGETVVDVGSGAGFDSLIAAQAVGSSGRVIGVDMTAEMLAKAEAGARQLGLANTEFRAGYAESMPIEDGTADLVISNGVINLCPNKQAVFSEIYRVLKPGGRMQVGDILVHLPVPQEAKDDVDLWSNCIAGSLMDNEWAKLLEMAGFSEIKLSNEVDVYSGSKHESDAKEFETRGVTVYARKCA